MFLHNSVQFHRQPEAELRILIFYPTARLKTTEGYCAAGFATGNNML